MQKIKDLTIEGMEFQIRKFNAMDQFHLIRRLALFQTSAEGFATAIATIPDDDAEVLFRFLLSQVYIKNKSAYERVSTKQAFMRDDLDLTVLLPLAIEVIQFNLGNFMNGDIRSRLSALQQASNS